jgi:hypothetical protein
MQTQVEAPGVEPRDVSGGVTVAGVEKAFGAVQALGGVSLRVRAARGRCRGRAERVRQVDAARARVRAGTPDAGP